MTTTADVVQMTFVGVDDRAFLAEKRRTVRDRAQRRKAIAEPRPLPDGPCCGRCAFWRAPGRLDDFGACRVLAVATARVAGGPEKGTVMTQAEAKREAWEWEPLSVKAWAEGCAGYQAEVAA